MLLETVVGMDVMGSENRMVWRIHRTDQHGVRRMPLGRHHRVQLVAAPRATASSPARVHITAVEPFTLVVERP